MIGRGECLKIKKKRKEGKRRVVDVLADLITLDCNSATKVSFFLFPFSLGFCPLSLLPPPLLLLVTDVVGDVSLIGLASSCMG